MTSHEEILKAARERRQLCEDADFDDRVEALDDLRFISGDQWPSDAAAMRDTENRPRLTINKLPTFLRQITNDQRQNTPSIKIHPVDSGADIETAKVLQGHIRHIEYSSNADTAYDTAVNSAARCGRGFFRLITEYESEDSFDQVIRFKRERNPLNVYIDPASQELDGSDAMFAFILDAIPKDEFKRQYPKAKATDDLDGLRGIGESSQGWMIGDNVIVAEYYWIEHVNAKLVMLSDGSKGYKEDLDEEAIALAGIQIIAERDTTRRTTKWAKITGCDVLEERDIPCRWIPVFPVYGEELDIEGKVMRSGLVRNAKDPSRMYNFWMSSATEEVALRPKTPYIGAEGQFQTDAAKWKTANVRSYPYIQYKPVAVNGTIAPPPQRSPMADVPVGVLQMAMHASEDIKATTGIYDASLGARSNETSGRAILARQREGDLSNFHFADNLNLAVRHAGRCLVDMIPHIYDAPRTIRILGEDEAVSFAEINQEQIQVGQDGAPIRTILNDLTVGKYDVTVSAGPSYTTQRQEAAESMANLAQAWPPLMETAGDLVIGNQDWPGAEEIAERIKRRIPPEIIGDENEEGPPAIPPQVQQRMQQMEQLLQQAQQALQEHESGLSKARIDAESRVAVAQINAQSRQDVEELKGMVQMLLQQMQPPAPLTAAAHRTGAPPPEIRQPTLPEQPQSPPQAGFSVSGPPNFDPATAGLNVPTSGGFPDDDMRMEP